ncbi:VWA domain-containing protein [Candidatus Bipolaricaulota bacterium]|nr:VWA domain-containing protein [Candidatus Bipolaricaulota bacterium]
MQKSRLAVLVLFLVVFSLAPQCRAGRSYTIDWTRARANGWANPLPSLRSLITNTDYDFDSPSYPKNRPHLNKRHAGTDIEAPQDTTAVYSIARGTVADLRSPTVGQVTNPGNMVVIIRYSGTSGGFYCVYGHIEAETWLRKGLPVEPGQKIGTVKRSGFPSHLHFGINTSSSIAAFWDTTADMGLGWGRTVPRTGGRPAVAPASVGWVDPIEYLSTTQAHTDIIGARTATILVMDVSGSMGWRWKGGVKIESAKQAALQFIEQVANEPRLPGVVHEIAVVTFSGDATLVLPLTNSYAQARRAVIQLTPTASTNVGAGLTTALQELEKAPGAQRFIILLSDGMTNRGLGRQQILSGPVVEARQKRICIHTVAFGDPGDIDEDFLRKIAAGSGCGSYNYAASGFQLFGTYVKIRHAMLGSNRIVEFTSETTKGSRVYVLPGQAIALGAFQLTGPARELHYTLAWSEPGRMRAKLVDPSGREVTYTYPGAKIYSGNGFSHVTVFSPKQDIWRVAAVVGTTFPRGIEYYGVTSARTGGIVIPYRIPKICIFDDICIPLPDLPTWLIVGISVTVLAVAVYYLLVGK